MTTQDWILDTPTVEDVSNASFQYVRKGFDPFEVQQFARAAGAELERLKEENDTLRARALAAESRADATMDENSIADYLGEETTRLLAAARETSQSIVARADMKAKQAMEAAFEEARQMRLEAAQDASSERRQASDEARKLVNEAKLHRRKILTELGTRRDAACAQLNDLLEGRDHLARSLTDISKTAQSLVGRLDSFTVSVDDFPNLDPDGDGDGQISL